MDFARQVEGCSAQEVAAATRFTAFLARSKGAGKTGMGHVIERFLGIFGDNEQRPDLPELGIEVKTLPLKRLKKGWAVKESTSLTMINYHRLADEPWARAHMREKIVRILWFPYEHDEDRRRCRFRRPFLWSPDEGDWPVFQKDYESVRAMVRQGKAHELSESLSRSLAARRKGSKGSMTSQPASSHKAKTRTWAFKACYTRPIADRHVFRRSLVSLMEQLDDLPDLGSVEDVVARRLGIHEGRTLREIAAETGAHLSGGKSGSANFVRDLLGVTGKGGIEEFEKLGITIKTVWARPDTLDPWEAISFPAVDLREFARTDWEDSEFSDQIDRILFIPLYSETREPQDDRTLGRPFFWSPTTSQRMGIQAEWRTLKDHVKKGHARYEPVLDENGDPRTKQTAKRLVSMRENRLPKMKETKFIHMRPHGTDADDTDLDPLGNEVTKQGLWLNKGFIKRILETERLKRRRAESGQQRLMPHP